ncbi:MAG: right-handed parallel beta-helix repeat-containing protein [Bryobacterales bacterium]|nr:right-handed parallel beta-helix repeat-containing protein [Bryobacterales bacterium]
MLTSPRLIGDSGWWTSPNPTGPRQVASLPIDGIARDIAVRGNFAFISTMGPTTILQIIDISDPAHPVKAGMYDFSPGQGRGLDVVDGVAYIADELGLHLVSVADPHHPVRLAFLKIQPGWQQEPTTAGVIADGRLAYVAATAGGLMIIVDVSDPSRPLRLGSTNTGINQAWDLALAGNFVYIADHGGGLHVVDVSDPARPAVVSALRMPLAEGVALAGNLAYVADGDRGLQVVDVSDPSRPTVVGSLATQGYARQVVVAGDRVYLADGLNGLLIIEKASGGSGKSAEAPLAGSRPMVAPSAATPVRHREPQIEQRRAGNAPSVASACVVTSVADSGVGTLRERITKGQSGVTITFDPAVFPTSDPATIRLASPLPPLRWGNTTIDGSEAGVVIDGGGYSARGAGITLRSEGNTIKGLQILGFSDNAIMIQGDHNVIGGDRSRGRGPIGEGNLISGNGGSGIQIGGANNVIIGNLVGTDLSGTRAFGNGYDGVFVTGGVNNRIGGPDPRDRNIISGNTVNGITINGPGNGNLVIGNYVGTDITGMIDLGNKGYGIGIELGGFNNVVQGNVSSGNLGTGILISDTGSSYNGVIGNRIGTNATGAKAIPNGQGVNVGFHEASFNRIGGLRPEERNLISGNGAALYITAAGNLVRGNYIGTDITGRQVLPNRGGLNVSNGTRAFVEGNVIGGNGFAGVNVSSSYGYFGNNFIGADASGQTAIPNNGFGVMVTGRHNIFQTNVIANNRSGGIGIDPLGYNTIRRDWIYGNAAKGIQYSSGSAGGLAAPVLTTVGAAAVSGTACADCEVEIFSDAGGQGRIFEGSIRADASGIFRFDKRSPLAGPNVTATATDRRGDTSEFSVPRAVPKP